MYMKKQRTGLWMFIVAVVLYSCKKEVTTAGETTVNLSVTTFYKNGSEETKYERSGAIERNSFAQPVTEGSAAKYLVNLGGETNAGTPSSFGVSFLFNQQTGPDAISGTYNFPLDQLLIRTTLRNEAIPFVAETIVFPTRGKLVLVYDRTSRRISGTIENLEFNPLPNDAFGRYRITLKGNFSGVPAR
jgi:hypothetical protein